MSDKDKVTLTREQYDDLINEVTALRTEKELARISRQTWIDSAQWLGFWMGIIGSVGMVAFALYFGYIYQSIGLLVMFGCAAILGIIQAYKIRPSPTETDEFSHYTKG